MFDFRSKTFRVCLYSVSSGLSAVLLACAKLVKQYVKCDMFPCLVLVLPVLLWYRSCFSPCQVSLLFDYCSLPNVSRLLLVACPVCVWYLSPCLSFVPCRIILVCGEFCPLCYLCSRCSLCSLCYPRHPCSLPF